jgi:hypothetical protein
MTARDIKRIDDEEDKKKWGKYFYYGITSDTTGNGKYNALSDRLSYVGRGFQSRSNSSLLKDVIASLAAYPQEASDNIYRI